MLDMMTTRMHVILAQSDGAPDQVTAYAPLLSRTLERFDSHAGAQQRAAERVQGLEWCVELVQVDWLPLELEDFMQADRAEERFRKIHQLMQSTGRVRTLAFTGWRESVPDYRIKSVHNHDERVMIAQGTFAGEKGHVIRWSADNAEPCAEVLLEPTERQPQPMNQPVRVFYKNLRYIGGRYEAPVKKGGGSVSFLESLERRSPDPKALRAIQYRFRVKRTGDEFVVPCGDSVSPMATAAARLIEAFSEKLALGYGAVDFKPVRSGKGRWTGAISWKRPEHRGGKAGWATSDVEIEEIIDGLE